MTLCLLVLLAQGQQELRESSPFALVQDTAHRCEKRWYHSRIPKCHNFCPITNQNNFLEYQQSELIPFNFWQEAASYKW